MSASWYWSKYQQKLAPADLTVANNIEFIGSHNKNMATNIEIKARVTDRKSVLERIRAVADGPGEIIRQRDVFFHCANGRLKLRYLNSDHGQLIFYRRANTTGPKASHYEIFETNNPDRLLAVMKLASIIIGEVKKERHLYLFGNTRIHVDRVDNLGDFIELEVVLQPGQTEAEGTAIADELMARLVIESGELIDRAYIDMLGTGQLDQ